MKLFTFKDSVQQLVRLLNLSVTGEAACKSAARKQIVGCHRVSLSVQINDLCFGVFQTFLYPS